MDLSLLLSVLSVSCPVVVGSLRATLCYGEWLTLSCPWPSQLNIDSAGIVPARDGCTASHQTRGTLVDHQPCSSARVYKEATSRCNGQSNCVVTAEQTFPDNCGLSGSVMAEIKVSCKSENSRHVLSNFSTFNFSTVRNIHADKADRDFCPEITKDGITWFKTAPGKIRERQCPGKATVRMRLLTGSCSWKCMDSGTWDPEGPDFSRCVAWTVTLEESIREANDSGNVHLASQKLYHVTENLRYQQNTGSDIFQVAQFLMEITEIAMKSQRPTKSSAIDLAIMNNANLKTLSNILEANFTSAWKTLDSKQTRTIGNSIMSCVEQGAFLVKMGNESSLQIRQNNIAVEIVHSGNQLHESVIAFPSPESIAAYDVIIGDSILISSDEVHKDVNETSKVVFVWYENLAEFIGDESASSRQVNSRILSASIGAAGQRRNLSKPATITLQHVQPTDKEHDCVYWNQDANTSERWLTEGCTVLSTNFTHTVCSCNHLTSFAVLVNHRGFKSTYHDAVLTYLTWIGLCLSLVCLALSIATFVYFRSLQSIRTSIHTNLCICLFASQLTFLAGIDQYHYPTACSIIAGVLHYFLLAAFTWMALEGVQLYVMLIEVFEKHTRVVWFYIVGYGFPAIFVSLSAGLNPSGYGTPTVCWLTNESNGTTGVTPLIWSFIAPVSFVALGNLAFVVLTACMMYRHGRKYIFYSRLKAIKGALKGTVALLFLLGTTWIFGLLWWWEGMVALQYLFCIFNAFQGVYIFVFHCLLHKKVRSEYRKLFNRQGCGKYSGVVSTSTVKVKYSSNRKSSSDRPKYRRSSSRKNGRSSSADDRQRKNRPSNRFKFPGTRTQSNAKNLRDASQYFSTQDRASMKILFTRPKDSQATPYLPPHRMNFYDGTGTGIKMRTFSTRSCPGSEGPSRKRPSSSSRDEAPFKRSLSERKHYRGKYNTPVSEGVTRILKTAASNHSIVPCRYLPAKAWENDTPSSTCTRTTTLSKDTSTLQRYHVPASPPIGPNSPTKEFKLVDKRLAKLKKINSSPSLGLGRASSWNAAEKKRREIQRRLEDQPSTSVPDLMTQLSEKIESRDISQVLLNYLDEDGTLNKQKLDDARNCGTFQL